MPYGLEKSPVTYLATKDKTKKYLHHNTASKVLSFYLHFEPLVVVKVTFTQKQSCSIFNIFFPVSHKSAKQKQNPLQISYSHSYFRGNGKLL